MTVLHKYVVKTQLFCIFDKLRMCQHMLAFFHMTLKPLKELLGAIHLKCQPHMEGLDQPTPMVSKKSSIYPPYPLKLANHPSPLPLSYYNNSGSVGYKEAILGNQF